MSIRTFTHLFVCPSTQAPLHPSVHLSIYLSFVHSFIHPSILSVRKFTCPFIRLPTHIPSISSVYLFRSYIRTSVHPTVFLPTHHSVRLPIHPVSHFTYPSVYPSVPFVSPLEKNMIGAKQPMGKTIHRQNNSPHKGKLTHP